MQNVAVIPTGHIACLAIGGRHGPQKTVKIMDQNTRKRLSQHNIRWPCCPYANLYKPQARKRELRELPFQWATLEW